MTTEETKIEQHGCIVCGKTYQLKVTYDAHGQLLKCLVLTPGGRRVVDSQHALVACDTHPAAKIEEAVAKHYPGHAEDEADAD